MELSENEKIALRIMFKFRIDKLKQYRDDSNNMRYFQENDPEYAETFKKDVADQIDSLVAVAIRLGI
jgi:hypothetical protein